jgi:hypothetical protein
LHRPQRELLLTPPLLFPQAQLEFWDLILFAKLFSPALDATTIGGMLTADPESPSALCKILSPDSPRQYSIACAPQEEGKPATQISLLVGNWQ